MRRYFTGTELNLWELYLGRQTSEKGTVERDSGKKSRPTLRENQRTYAKKKEKKTPTQENKADGCLYTTSKEAILT